MTKTSIGNVVNLLANDAIQLKETYFFLQMLWIAPILVIVLTLLLWQQVGIVSLVGLGVQITIIVQQAFCVSLLVKFRYFSQLLCKCQVPFIRSFKMN